MSVVWVEQGALAELAPDAALVDAAPWGIVDEVSWRIVDEVS